MTDTVSEVDNNSFCATVFYTVMVMTPLDATDRLAVPAASMVDIWYSKTESDVGYISVGADELDSDIKPPAGLRSNCESGYLSCYSKCFQHTALTNCVSGGSTVPGYKNKKPITLM